MGEAADSLKPQHRMFVEAYLSNGFNAARAARTAGYQDTRVHPTRLLAQASIKGAIQERLGEIAMEANEVLVRLGDQARATMEDFTDEQARLDLKAARDRGKFHLVRELSCEEVYEPGQGDEPPQTVRKIKFKLHDAQAALVQIGRHHGLFTDKQEHSGEVVVKSYGAGVDLEKI